MRHEAKENEKEKETDLADVEYPRGDALGLPSRRVRDNAHFPTSIDWFKDVIVKRVSVESPHMGIERAQYEIRFTDDYLQRSGVDAVDVTRITHALRSMLVDYVPSIAIEVVEDHGTVLQGSLLHVVTDLKLIPVLGVDVVGLEPYRPGATFDGSNSYRFQFKTGYVPTKESVPVPFQTEIIKEHKAASELERELGPVDVQRLRTIPDVLRPHVRSFLHRAQDAPFKLQMTQPPRTMIYSQDAVWKPFRGQRQAWLKRHGYTNLTLEDQDAKLRVEGPRLAPGVLVAQLSRDDRLDLCAMAVLGLPVDHAKYAAGARPYPRYPRTITGLDKVKGAAAWEVASTCPARCFDLTWSGNRVVDIEDMTAPRLSMHPDAPTHLGLVATRPDVCKTPAVCGTCRNIDPRIMIQEDLVRIYFFVESHSAMQCDDMLDVARQLLMHKYAPPQKIIK